MLFRFNGCIEPLTDTFMARMRWSESPNPVGSSVWTSETELIFISFKESKASVPIIVAYGLKSPNFKPLILCAFVVIPIKHISQKQ